MYRQEQIAEIAENQTLEFLNKDTGIPREFLSSIPQIENFATIITGIRRCGKSTLLLQLFKNETDTVLYFNWEDIRIAGFETDDFVRLYKEIIKQKVNILFFDEIQLVPKWEIFVHQLLREGFRVFITGSNATLLSKELGTHLTGRHLSVELFPFSFSEFCQFTRQNADDEAVNDYLHTGGMPEFVRTRQSYIIQQLVEDIITRDIAVRYNIRDGEALRQLTVYLMSNVGNIVSANKLAGMFGIKSASTILEYFSHLTNSYLVDFIPQFDYSLKAQTRNPKKVYGIDTGLVSEISLSFSRNTGHIFENMIYNHLRMKYKEILFFNKKGECDFVIKEKEKITQAIQVCLQLTDENFRREYDGLLEAMNYFNLDEGLLITKNETDVFQKDGKTIRVVTARQFLSNSYHPV